jgi:hypothetical protein
VSIYLPGPYAFLSVYLSHLALLSISWSIYLTWLSYLYFCLSISTGSSTYLFVYLSLLALVSISLYIYITWLVSLSFCLSISPVSYSLSLCLPILPGYYIFPTWLLYLILHVSVYLSHLSFISISLVYLYISP